MQLAPVCQTISHTATLSLSQQLVVLLICNSPAAAFLFAALGVEPFSRPAFLKPLTKEPHLQFLGRFTHRTPRAARAASCHWCLRRSLFLRVVDFNVCPLSCFTFGTTRVLVRR